MNQSASATKKIRANPMQQLIHELSGSIVVPKHLRGRDIDEVIEEAKGEHFKSKYQSKNFR